jgi:flap endonuclease-1
VRDALPANVDAVRQYFLEPEVEPEPEVHRGRLDPEGVVRFLCEERGFSEDRVRPAVARLDAVGPAPTTLDDFP